MPTRSSEFLPSDDSYSSLPRRNTSYDLLKKSVETTIKGATLGFVGAVWPETRIVEANIGASPTICSTTVGHTHWYSGGEFTLPYPGLACALYSENGTGTILGYLPAQNTKAYYRLSYGHPVKKDVVEEEEKPFDDYRGGYPPDILHGDQGYLTLDGYGYGVLAGGPVFMRANPLAQIEFFDLDNTAKLSSYNYIQYTGQGELVSYTNAKKAISNTRFYGGSDFVKPEISTDETEESVDFEDETVPEFLPEYQYFWHLGSIGRHFTFHVKDKYHKNVHDDGEDFNRSSKGIIHTVGSIPKIEGNINNFDPEKAELYDEDIREFEPFEWSEEGGRISQQPFYMAGFIDKYFQTFKVAVEEPAEDDDAEAEAEEAASTVASTKDGVFHIRDDGSIIIMSKGGSTIEATAEGDIIISPKRHLKLQSGGSTTILAGNEIQAVAKESISLKSTDKSIQLAAQDKLLCYSYSNMILDTDSSEGISLKAPHGNIENRAFNIYNVARYRLSNNANILDSKAPIEQKTVKRRIDTCDHEYKIGKNYIAKYDRIHSIKSDQYYWFGRRFLFNASSSGVLNATNPIRVNHVHQRGFGGVGDIYTFARCGEHCKYVKRIETPPLGIQDFEPTIPEKETVSTPSEKSLSFSETIPEDLTYYYTPWQVSGTITGGGSFWTTLARKFRGQDLFPNTVPLKTYTGRAFRDLTWNGYLIS